MKLKLISLTALTALGLRGAALAQDQNTEESHRGGGHGGMRHDPMERITERLNLTPEQKTKLQPILDEAKPKVEAIRRDALQKTKAVMDETMAKIRPLLTPEQQTKLDEAKNRRRGGGREERQGEPRNSGGGGDEDNG